MPKLIVLTALLTLAACVGASTVGEPNAKEKLALQGRAIGEPVSCLTTRDIRDTDAITDRVLLFHLDNGRTYRNDLPHACPQLTRTGNAFSYRSTIGRLCAIDVIQVFDPTTGIGYGGCQLGKFQRYELPAGVNRSSF